MQQQIPQISPFDVLLKRLYDQIADSQFDDALITINAAKHSSEHERREIDSLKAYVLTMTKQYSLALHILENILQKCPFHLPSKKRKAVILEKMGKSEESKKQFQHCLFLQPESRSLRNKLKRLNMSTSYSEGFSSDSKQSSNLQEKEEEIQKAPSLVKFGSFQVIEFNTEDDSDEHFAMIKKEISKLSDKKPSKSILKESMSARVFKQKHKEAEKIQQTAEKASAQADPEMEKFVMAKEPAEKKKKKAKSVSFTGDTTLDDVQ